MPLFNWTENEGWATLPFPRGVSTFNTIPDLPTFPFHFDLPT